MSPEPIRDYVGEALRGSANGKTSAFNINGGDAATSATNKTDFKAGGFQCKAAEPPSQERKGYQREQPPPNEPRWKEGSFTAEQLQVMKFAPTSFLVEDIIPAEGLTLLCSKPKFGKSWLAYDLCIGCTTNRSILGEIMPAQGDVLYLALEDSRRRLQRRMSSCYRRALRGRKV